jgi:ABC-type phosphate transport system permease subunit
MMKESAYGIGCTTWEVIWRIVLPFTKNGVIGGVMLGLGRALGETMAVTFIIGNTYQLDSARSTCRVTVLPLRWRMNLPKRNPGCTLRR